LGQPKIPVKKKKKAPQKKKTPSGGGTKLGEERVYEELTKWELTKRKSRQVPPVGERWKIFQRKKHHGKNKESVNLGNRDNQKRVLKKTEGKKKAVQQTSNFKKKRGEKKERKKGGPQEPT